MGHVAQSRACGWLVRAEPESCAPSWRQIHEQHRPQGGRRVFRRENEAGSSSITSELRCPCGWFVLVLCHEAAVGCRG
jgi:hypothetical protein